MAKNKMILVTGGCGYIGSHVVCQLTEQGHSVLVLDNLSTGFADALLHGERLIVGDVGDEALLARIFAENPIDTIFHFAASILVDESVRDPLLYYRNNTTNTIKLLEAAVKSKKLKHFVLSSTAAVYGIGDGTPLCEDDHLDPQSPYGRSKLMDEWILADAAKAHGFSFAALRYFNVAGADHLVRIGERPPIATHLIKVASQVAVGKRALLTVYGTDYPTPDGTCVRDYIHVEDIASAHLSALKHLKAGGKSAVLNCGYQKGFSVNEVVTAVEQVLGRKLPSEVGARRAGDVPVLVADSSAIRRTLDWEPRYEDLPAIIRSAIAWEKKLG